MSLLRTLLLALVLVAPVSADPFVSTAWTSTKTVSEDQLNNIDQGINDAMVIGLHSGLEVIGGEISSNEVHVKADYLTVTNGTTHTVVTTVNVTGSATNATIALKGQDTTFTVADNTWYAVYIVAKEDGTTSLCYSEDFDSPDLTDSTWDGYTLWGKVTEVFNETASTWDIKEFWQLGSEYAYVDSRGVDATATAYDSTGTAASLTEMDLSEHIAPNGGFQWIRVLDYATTGTGSFNIRAHHAFSNMTNFQSGDGDDDDRHTWIRIPNWTRNLYYTHTGSTYRVALIVQGFTLRWLAR